MYVRRVSCLWISCFAFIEFHLPTYHHRPSITLILPLPVSLSVLRLSLKKLPHHTSADQSNVLHSFERSRTFCELFLHALWLVNIAGTWWWWWWWWWCMWVSEWSEMKWSEVEVSGWGREWGSEWVSDWVCVCGWVGEWVSGWASERVSQWVSESVSQWVSQWVSEWVRVCVCVSGWVGEWVSGWVGERVSESASESEWVRAVCYALCVVFCGLCVVVCYVLWERRGVSLGRKVVVDVDGLPLTSALPANVVSARPKSNRLVRTKADEGIDLSAVAGGNIFAYVL